MLFILIMKDGIPCQRDFFAELLLALFPDPKSDRRAGKLNNVADC